MWESCTPFLLYRDIFALTNREIIATVTNLPEFIKDIKKEI